MAEVRWRKGTTPRLLVSTGIDLTGFSSLKLHFKKPGGGTFVRDDAGTGSTPAVDDNSAPAAGQLGYDFDAAELDEVNQWQVVPEVVISGKIYKGVPAATFTVVDDFDT